MRRQTMGELKFSYKRTDLLARVEQNRDTHATAYMLAMEGYWVAIAERATETAKAAKSLAKKAQDEAVTWKDAKKPSDPSLALPSPSILPRPEDHRGDYDRVIDMLKLAQDESIELDEEQFAMYVRDEWEWKANFTATSMSYSNNRA